MIRYAPAEKRDIIRLVEESDLPVKRTLEERDTRQRAVDKTGIQYVHVKHRPPLPSDHGPAFIADALRDYLRYFEIDHLHGRPLHPQTQGKIERYHRSMKSVVKLNTFFFPWELEQAVADFVVYYNTQRYHESPEKASLQLVQDAM